MKIYKTESGPVQTMGYIAYHETSGDAVIIDTPPESSEKYIAKVKELNLHIRSIFLTHSHWDHSAEAPKLRAQYNVPVYIHKADEYRVEEPSKHTIWPLPFKLEPFTADKYFEDGQILQFGTLQCRILHTPGHTEGGVCIYFPDDNSLFTGDTLFNMSVGRVDLPGGDLNTLFNSIRTKILVLDENTDIYPGHGEQSTIGFERRHNPFLNSELK